VVIYRLVQASTGSVDNGHCSCVVRRPCVAPCRASCSFLVGHGGNGRGGGTVGTWAGAVSKQRQAAGHITGWNSSVVGGRAHVVVRASSTHDPSPCAAPSHMLSCAAVVIPHALLLCCSAPQSRPLKRRLEKAAVVLKAAMDR
jgi:hypothetical protein